MSARYYLKTDWQNDWVEVSLEEFVKAERAAGFCNKAGGPTATGGFSSGSVTGRVTYTDENEENIV